MGIPVLFDTGDFPMNNLKNSSLAPMKKNALRSIAGS